VTSSKAVSNVTQEIFDNVPKGRSYQSMIFFATGARKEPLQGLNTGAGGGYQIDGASDAENAYLVEGMDTGKILNGRSGVDVPFEFIQEVQVKTSGFEAEHGGAMGGVVNVIQKRGGNTWHGSILAKWVTDGLNANDAPSLRNNPADTFSSALRTAERGEYYQTKEDRRNILEPGFSVGGPIFKNHLHLFASYLPTIDRLERTVKFTRPGFLGNRSFSRSIDTHSALGRLDGKITDRLRAFAAWQYAYQRQRGTALPGADSVSGQTNGSAGTDPTAFRQDSGAVLPNSVYTFGADFTITPKAVLTGRYGYWFTNFGSRGLPSGPRYVFTNSNVGMAGVPATFQNTAGFQNITSNAKTLFDAFKRKSINTDLSLFLTGAGTHNLKFGYSINKLSNDIINGSDGGVIVLAWGEAFSQGPCPPTLPAANCQGPFGHYWVQDFATLGKVSSDNQAFYVQDAWTVGKGVTLNLGVRFDKEFIPSFAAGGQNIEFGYGDKFAPRIGAAWDVKQNGKLKIYGSYGLFYDIFKYYLPRGAFGGDYWHNCYQTIDDPNYTLIVPTRTAANTYCPPPAAYPGRFLGEFNFRSVSNDPKDSLLDPLMRPMRQQELIFGADWAISPMFALETRYARKRLDRAIDDVGVLGDTVETYYIGNPGEGNLVNLLARTVSDGTNTGFTAPPVCPTCNNTPKPKRDYDAVEFRLTRRASAKWFGSMSYTWSRLYGNYGGLSSSDEPTRNDAANASRYYDLPHMQFDATGKPSYGPLATDRPHTMKAWAWYKLNWLGMETTVGGAQQLYQGTPITTAFPVASSSSAVQYVVGRGNFLPLTRAANGDLVAGTVQNGARMEVYQNTDLSLHHDIKVSKTNEALRLGFGIDVENIFNQNNVIRVAVNPLRNSNTTAKTSTGSHDWLALTTTGWNFIGAANGVAQNNTARSTLANTYGQANGFQAPRNVRLMVKFSF
ncbi:MAG: TonB-dependent receptor, partial [Terriglobales bacterium]